MPPTPAVARPPAEGSSTVPVKRKYVLDPTPFVIQQLNFAIDLPPHSQSNQSFLSGFSWPPILLQLHMHLSRTATRPSTTGSLHITSATATVCKPGSTLPSMPFEAGHMLPCMLYSATFVDCFLSQLRYAPFGCLSPC